MAADHARRPAGRPPIHAIPDKVKAILEQWKVELRQEAAKVARERREVRQRLTQRERNPLSKEKARAQSRAIIAQPESLRQCDLIKQLTNTAQHAELAAMWANIERKTHPDPPNTDAPEQLKVSVRGFVAAASEAKMLSDVGAILRPRPTDDAKAAKRIRSLAQKLADELERAGLDRVNLDKPAATRILPALDGQLHRLREFSVYIDHPSAADRVRQVGENAAQLLDPVGALPDHNDEGRNFVLVLATYTQAAYEEPLYSVLATACNAICGTNYTRHTIGGILKPRKHRKRA